MRSQGRTIAGRSQGRLRTRPPEGRLTYGLPVEIEQDIGSWRHCGRKVGPEGELYGLWCWKMQQGNQHYRKELYAG